MNELIVLSGANHLNVKSTCKFKSNKFKNGETTFRLKCSVRYKNVIIIQSFPDVNDNLIELLLCIDACKKGGSKYITVILPIFPYSRQDRIHKSGFPISAQVICSMLSSVGIHRLITFDLHSNQIQGFSKEFLFDHIELTSFLTFHIKKILTNINEWCFVSPDAGAIKRVKKFADFCNGKDLVVMDKTRTKASVIDKIQLIGDVKYKNCIIVDDMIDSGGTLKAATNELSSRNCYDIFLCCSHGIFSPPADENLSGLNICCTNTLPITIDQTQFNSFHIFDISPFIQEVINLINDGKSFGKLFTSWHE
jgi:ribose-phosphate pyrophosphokinase